MGQHNIWHSGMRVALSLGFLGLAGTMAYGEEPVAPMPSVPEAGTMSRPAALSPTEVAAPTAPSKDTSGQPVTFSDDTFSVPVEGVTLVYDDHSAPAVAIEQVETELDVTLAQTEKGMAAVEAAPEGTPVLTFKLRDIPSLSQRQFTASGIQSLSRQIVEYYNNRGIVGVVAGPSSLDINAQGQDLRQDSKALRMVVRVGMVDEIRTLGSGEGVSEEQKVDGSDYARIKANSPVQSGAALDKEALDGYLGYLNRHPNRRVDVALSRGVKEGTVAMDYLVAENKPWMVYGQMSNTGTPETNEWRYRFGINHSQLTRNDDILDLQYSTAGFNETHFLQGSYEAPVFNSTKLRWKVFGSWSEYTAHNVGGSQTFEGDSWNAGGQLVANLVQTSDFYLDAFAGMRWQNNHTKSSSSVEGEADFLLPMVGASLGYHTMDFNTDHTVSIEWNANDLADTNPGSVSAVGTGDNGIVGLGRSGADTYWLSLNWNNEVSFYLEPLLNREAWSKADPANEAATLAHEIALSLSGNYAISGRLPAPFQGVAGGLYSVRGYPESTAAGDGVLIGRAEYRMHISRLFPVGSLQDGKDLSGGKFRMARTSPYGRPDWDLIFRTFLDIGQTFYNNKLSFENEETLIGAGVGLELLLKHNISLRADWGIALQETEAKNVQEGDNRFHFVFTFMY